MRKYKQPQFPAVKLNARVFLYAILAFLMPMFKPAELRATDITISGVYVGSMHLVDGSERDIPLAVALVLTDETTSTPNGLEYVIDGSFVVDDEGGPYTFTKVSYDIDNNRFDMKYARERLDPTALATFRLIGGFDGDNGITGRVTGIYGPIGTFVVKRSNSVVTLPFKQKYLGSWRGSYRNIRFNSGGIAQITLQPSSKPTQNPTGMEFDFTPGRTGGYTYNGTWITSFSQVIIDYLRRKIIMTDPQDLTTIELSVDFDKKTAKGQQSSAQYGVTTIFDHLSKIE